MIDFLGKLQALAQRRLVRRLIASSVAPPRELTSRPLLSALLYDSANAIRKQSTAGSIHDNVADCQPSPVGSPARLIVDRKREAAYLPIIIGSGVSARREASARDDCEKSRSFQKFSRARSESHGFSSRR